MKIGKFENLAANLHDKTEHIINTRSLKQALNNNLVLKKVHKVIKFNQNYFLKKTFIDMNIYLSKKAKNDCEKDSFKFMNKATF